MAEQLAVRSVVNTAALPQVLNDDLDKAQWKLSERFARLVALKAPTHQPEPVQELARRELTELCPSTTGVENNTGSKMPSAELNAASASESASVAIRSSSPASATSHSKPSSITDESRNSGTSCMTTIASTSTTEGHEVLELEKGVFVAPKLLIPCEDVEKWNIIQPRLEDVLLNLFKPKPGLDPSLSLELVMAGPFKAPLKSSIVLTCCNEPHRKRLKKLLKSQKWLASTGYPLVVVIDPIQQLSLVQRRTEPSPYGHNTVALSVGLGVGLGLGILSLMASIAFLLWRRRRRSHLNMSRREIDENGNRILSWIRGQDSIRKGPNIMTSEDSPGLEEQDPSHARMMQQSNLPGFELTPEAAMAQHTPTNKPMHKPSSSVFAQMDSLERVTMCGAPAMVYICGSQHAYFTIGGTVLIDGSMYGLAAGHSLSLPDWENNLPDEVPESNGGNNVGSPLPDLDSDSDSESEPASPWLCPVHERGNVINTPDAPSSQHQIGDNITCAHSSSSVSRPSLQPYEPQVVDIPTERKMIGTVQAPVTSSHDHGQEKVRLDWGLIQLVDKRCWTVNKLTSDPSSSPEEITDIAETAHLLDGEVTVITGFTGVAKGWLKQGPVMLRLRSHTYEARQIVLERPLVRGDSGAWVVRDGMFCGHIVAQKTLSPIAYMLPAQSILEDIKRCLGTSNVTLPVSSH
ncbi:hypothetical protein PG997_014409 [Apiospora hydei]|uniref:Uncharacterized protein n=1 Tax=Apiospora hydei TaxID=1337664 RepID=A0ABR1UTQ6_9PEZI